MSSLAMLTAGTPHSEDLSRLFKDTQASALHFLNKQDYTEALKHLSQNEGVLEEVIAQEYKADPDFVLVTLHNLACCYQGLEKVENSAAYLEACLYNLEGRERAKGREMKQNCMWKGVKYECRAKIQLCALFSQIDRHEAALIHAQAGMKLSQNLLLDVYSLCQNHLIKHHKLASESLKHTVDYKHNHSLVKAAYPLLAFLENCISARQYSPTKEVRKLETRSALGVQRYSNWIYSVDMTEIMRIKPITLLEVKQELDSYSELAKNSLVDKVCLLIAALFCVATELRMLYGEEDRRVMIKAQACHYKALQLAKAVLPVESPLLEHLAISYQKHFSGLGSPRRPNILDRSARFPFKLTFPTKPRSSSAKSTQRGGTFRSSLPNRRRKHTSKAKEKLTTPIPLTDRSMPVYRSSSRKPFKDSPRAQLRALARTESPEEVTLNSAELYGPGALSMRHIEYSTDFHYLQSKNSPKALASGTGGAEPDVK